MFYTLPWVMSAKTIALDEEAYELLSKAKRPGETFSHVVKRTVRPRVPLVQFAGAWKDIPAAKLREIQRIRRESRKLDRKREKDLEARWK